MDSIKKLLKLALNPENSLFKSRNLVFFADGGEGETGEGRREAEERTSTQQQEKKSKEKKAKKEEKEEREEKTDELSKEKPPAIPRDTAPLEKWKEYEKEIGKRIRAIQAEEAKGPLTTAQRKIFRELRTNRSIAKRRIRLIEEESVKKTEKELGVSSLPITRLQGDIIRDKRIDVRRFLKNSNLLLAPGEREKPASESVFTDWERAILDLHDLDQEINLMLVGKKFYVGSEKKDTELQQKSDLILKLQVDLDGDIARYKKDKDSYPLDVQKTKEKEFEKRQDRINELKKTKENEMLAQINMYIEDLEKKRHEKKLKVLEKMFIEFDRRILRLMNEWKDPPDEYKHNQPTTQKHLKNMSDYLVQFQIPVLEKNALKRHKSLLENHKINDLLDEDLKVMREVDMQLDNCEMRNNAKARALDPDVQAEEIPSITEMTKLQEGLNKRYPMVSKDAAEINENQDDVLELLNKAKNILQKTPLEDFGGSTVNSQEKEKKARIEMMDTNIEKVKSNSMDPKMLEKEFGLTTNELNNLKNHVSKEDPETTESKEKRRDFKNTVDQTTKYFDSISNFKNEIVKLKAKLSDFETVAEQIKSQKAESAGIEVSCRWLTGQDMVRIWEHFREWSKRRWERKSDDRVGEVGSRLFDVPGWSISKSLANEYDKIKEQAEITEVQQYQDAYKNKDNWQIVGVMENTKNQDELKATLLLLSENGRLRFDNPKLWKQLEYFQNTIKICPDYTPYEIIKLKNNPMELHSRIHKAIGYIWDFDTYYSMKNTQDNAYESKKNDWMNRCDQLSEVEGGLGKKAHELLSEYKRDKRNGLTSKVNPHEYEAIIEYCIKFGKMAGEDKLYYLIQGLACGLLEYPDRLIYFNSKYLNEYPILESFTGKTGRSDDGATWEDIVEWAKLDGDLNKPGMEYKQWHWTWAAHKPRALQRIDKTLTQGSNRMDHDDVTSVVSFGSANTIKNMLKKSYGGEYGLPSTGFANTTVSYLYYLDNWAMNSNNIDQAVVQLERVVNAFTTFYNVTKKRIFKNRDYFTFDRHMLYDPTGPRYARAYETIGSDRAQTVNDFMEKSKSLISALEPELFARVYHEDIPTNQKYFKETINWIKEKYGSKVFEGKDPQSYEDFIENGFPMILNKLLTGDRGKKRIKDFMTKVKGDISGSKTGHLLSRNLDAISEERGYVQPDIPDIAKANAKFLPLE